MRGAPPDSSQAKSGLIEIEERLRVMTKMEGVERVLEDPSKFKNMLGIGDKATKRLKWRELAREGFYILDAAGAGATGMGLASTTAVAVIFAEVSILATLGLVATPVGWVIAAGVASAAGFYGISLYLRGDRMRFVDAPTELSKTLLDVLAVALFNFFVPLGLKVAALDDKIHESERRYIIDYLANEWGYSKRFVQSELPKLECNVETFPTVEVVNSLIEYKKSNSDCNYEPMAKELARFLMGVTEANGELHDQEVIFIQWLEITLARGRSSSVWDKLISAVRFSRRSKKETQGSDGSAANRAFDKNVPNSNGDRGGEDRNERGGNRGQDNEDEDGSSQDASAPDSTWTDRNVRSPLRWARGKLSRIDR